MRMRLRSIEILGFKSFPRRTKIELSDRITVFVGPNGCGKSNVCDALVWALGEQSPRLLRGQRMQEVIFSGTETLKPLSFAQVRLHFVGASGWLKVPFDEIVITRRMYRSGESQFLINQTPCRLRDIQELFLDSGVGARSYSVVPQGQTSQLIEQKPTERRLVIEEAAGIQRFKHRKRMALARLAETESNLVRVDQRIVDISRAARTLRSQAEKAQHFKDLQRRSRELKVRLGCDEYVRICEQLAAEQSKLEELESQKEKLCAALVETRKRLEEVDRRLQGLSTARQEKQRRLAEETKEAEALRLSTARHSEKIKSQEQQLRSSREELGEAVERAKGMQAEIESVARSKKRVLESLRKLQEQIADAHRLSQEGRREVQRLSLRLEELRSGRMRIATELAKTREEQKGASSRLERLVSEIAAAEAGLSARKQALADLGLKIEGAKRELGVLEESLLQDQKALEELEAGLRDASEARDAAARARDVAASELAATRSRLQTTRELISQLEGFEEGVRAVASVWRKKFEPAEAPEAICDVLEVSKGYERPIEAVLGQRLQSLVMSDFGQIKEAVGYLRANDAGRGWFVPREAMGDRCGSHSNPEPMPGTLGPALKFVKSSRYPGLAEALLGDVWVVEDFEKAVALWRSNGNGATFVTLSGDVLERTGLVSGGSESAGPRLLARRRELADLQLREAELTKELSAAEIGLTRASEKLAGITVALQEAQKRAHLAKLALVESQAAVSDLVRKQEVLSEEIASAGRQQQSREAEKGRLASLLGSLEDKVRGLCEEGTRLEREVLGLEASVATKSKECAKREKELIRLTQRRAVAQQRLKDLAAQEKRLGASYLSITSKIEEKRRLLAQLQAQTSRLGRELTAKSRRLAELERSIERLSQQASDEAARQGKLFEERGALAADYERGIERERSLSSRIGDLRVKVSQLEAQRRAVLERLEAERPGFSDKRSVEELLSEYSPEQPIPAKTRDEMHAELLAIQQQLGRLGEVNFAAIEDYKSTKEELDLLRAQRADIARSIRLINRTIGRIDREAHRRFMEAFDAISGRFGEIFRDLFGGGSASLKLVGSDDILEAGVEIMAQPTGKRKIPIGLLSGGEKALASIALTFALFEHRPTPMCILDEIDASLDEANTIRFVNRLRRYAESTQFLVITHNRKTMELADVLYGVTMQTEGVSKLLRVRMEDLAGPERSGR